MPLKLLFEKSPEWYVRKVVANYRVAGSPFSPAYSAARQMYPLIRVWAKGSFRQVPTIKPSGSYAKGTVIKGGTDIDLFISLSSRTPDTLEDIYESLYGFFKNRGYATRRQNASVRIQHRGFWIDLVPGRKQAVLGTDHSIYLRKAGKWTKTNVHRHVEIISKSGRVLEICAIKIWRNLHALDFPSFYLELSVLEALSGKRKGRVAVNTLAVFEYLGSEFVYDTIMDPANSNNLLSDELTMAQRKTIARQANTSLSETDWGKIIW